MTVAHIPTDCPRMLLAGRHPYAALAVCMAAARRAGWRERQIRACRSGDGRQCDDVLQACREWFQER